MQISVRPIFAFIRSVTTQTLVSITMVLLSFQNVNGVILCGGRLLPVKRRLQAAYCCGSPCVAQVWKNFFYYVVFEKMQWTTCRRIVAVHHWNSQQLIIELFIYFFFFFSDIIWYYKKTKRLDNFTILKIGHLSKIEDFFFT